MHRSLLSPPPHPRHILHAAPPPATRSVGLPGCQSTLKPGVWHTLTVHADHMWAHADETLARDVFERLALSLRLAADGGGIATVPPLGRPVRVGVRRSPRLLARTRRSGSIAAATAATAGNLRLGLDEEEDGAREVLGGGVACGGGPGALAPSRGGLGNARYGVRCCDGFSSVGGQERAGGWGGEVGEGSGAVGDDGVPSLRFVVSMVLTVLACLMFFVFSCISLWNVAQF